MTSVFVTKKSQGSDMEAMPGTPQRLLMLDLVRGLSALAVLLGHLRLALFPGFDLLIDPDIATKLAYLMTGFGNQAVVIFFVLSGYLVGGNVLRTRHRYDVAVYGIARISRLWVVLIPALLLTLALDMVIANWVPHVLKPEHMHHSGLDFVGNLFFLQTVWVPVWGSNGPLWSLACEAWYYVAFPLWVWGVLGSSNWSLRVFFLVLLVALMSAMPSRMFQLFPCWVLGALAHQAPESWHWLRHRVTGAVLLCLFLTGLGMSRLEWIPTAIPRQDELTVALLCAAWCAHLHVSPRQTGSRRFWAWATRLSDMSFSLYLIHMPLVLLLVGAWSTAPYLPPTMSTWCLFLGFAVLIVIASWWFWYLFERRAPDVRRFMLKQLVAHRTANATTAN